MPRQRSKKLSASRKAESSTVADFSKDEAQHQGDSDSDNGSEILDKDAEEEELDRLVLGDGFGFKAILDKDTNMQDGESEDGENDSVDQDSEGEAGLEGVDDADVSSFQANACERGEY